MILILQTLVTGAKFISFGSCFGVLFRKLTFGPFCRRALDSFRVRVTGRRSEYLGRFGSFRGKEISTVALTFSIFYCEGALLCLRGMPGGGWELFLLLWRRGEIFPPL